MSSAPSVLCVVDLSHRCGKVVQHAWAVADHFRAHLIVTTVATAETPAMDALTALVRRVLPGSNDWAPECRVSVATSRTADTILRLAHDEGVDLLVIGTHGAHGDHAKAFGSTTADVLRHADLPVLVVPNSVADLHSFDDRHELRSLANVLAPIDFGPLSRRDAGIAHGIAETLGVPLLLVHVSPAEPSAPGLDSEAALARLSALRAAIGGSTPIETLAVRGEPAAAIAAIASERNVGLMVMGLRGAGGADGPRPGSIAHRMLRTMPAMLLALPPVLRRPAPESHIRTRAVCAR